MDTQLPSPNAPTPVERSANAAAEDLSPNVGISPEVPSQSGAASAPPIQATPAPTLSANGVATAIAATPAPAANKPLMSTPDIAGDVDVIEPEWVEKAESVVREHQGDPYGEEEAVEVLQQEYLQKRYGISVANPDAVETNPKGS